MKELVLLEVLYGFIFLPKDDGSLIYHHEGERPTEAERTKIAKLLEVVKERKMEAVQFLKTRRSMDDVIPFLYEAAGECKWWRARRKPEVIWRRLKDCGSDMLSYGS